MNRRMPFGKHQGKLLTAIPSGYLAWVLENVHNLDFGLHFAISQELRRRDRLDEHDQADDDDGPAHLPANVDQLITKAHRELALKYHPDRGGSEDIMKGINITVEKIRQLVKARN